jgi:hypothetical protein
LIEELRTWVGSQLSPIAKPDEIRLSDNLPKTRSGKIMRRLLRAIARGEDITQDMSTLENPGILDQLRGEDAPVGPVALPVTRAAPVRRKPVKHAAVPRKKTIKKTVARKKRVDAARRAKRAKSVKRTKAVIRARRAKFVKRKARSKK